MFKVQIRQKDHYWNSFVFAFESLEEAQQFVQSAMKHFIKEEDTDDEDMVISIEFKQKFTTAKEEENESNSSD